MVKVTFEMEHSPQIFLTKTLILQFKKTPVFQFTGRMEETPVEEGDTNKDVEVAPALIAVHPAEKSVAVAVGSDLRVFDLVWVFSDRLTRFFCLFSFWISIYSYRIALALAIRL